MSARLSPDGTFIASCSLDGTARLWDWSSGACFYILAGHVDAVQCLDVSPCSRLIVTCGGSNDKTVVLWNAADVVAATGMRKLPVAGTTVPMAGRSAATSTHALPYSATLGYMFTFGQHRVAARAGPRGRRGDGRGGGGDGDVPVSAAVTGAPASSLDIFARLDPRQQHTKWVNSCRFSPDGAMVVTASSDCTVKVGPACSALLFCRRDCQRIHVALRSLVRVVLLRPHSHNPNLPNSCGRQKPGKSLRRCWATPKRCSRRRYRLTSGGS